MAKKSFLKKKKHQLSCKRQAQHGNLNNHNGDFQSESTWKSNAGATSTIAQMHLSGSTHK